MSVQNVECQIAQAQIGRYLTGGALSPEALDQLEGHIGECAACTELLRQRREGLQAMLGGHAAVHAPETNSRPEAESNPAPTGSLVGRLREQLIQAATAPAPPREGAPEGRALLKPLLWSGALAVVLVAMTVLSKNPTLVFGEKAAPPTASEKAQPDAEPPAPPSSPPKPAEKTPEPVATATPETKQAGADPVSQANPTPAQPKPTPAKPNPARPAATPPRVESKAPPPKPASGTIRVYDANGNPITPRSQS
ncbi:MAG: zf-HC2 domain-containing protein [Chthonomonadaceae bacterium]|nr:zf-HC2 domain-containing protein [Chthonomonadaceae bacterium]